MASKFNNMGPGAGKKGKKGLEPLDRISETDPPMKSANRKAVDGPPAAEPSASTDSGGLEFILDVPLEIAVELGRTKMLVNELLKLGQGSVIELSKIAGESMDIMANQKLIARGEVVVTNEKYGVRLTDVITPAERLERLR